MQTAHRCRFHLKFIPAVSTLLVQAAGWARSGNQLGRRLHAKHFAQGSSSFVSHTEPPGSCPTELFCCLTAFLGEAGDGKLPADPSTPAWGCSGFFLITRFHRRYQRCSWARLGSPFTLPTNQADCGMQPLENWDPQVT